jgi:hypothetical protein
MIVTKEEYQQEALNDPEFTEFLIESGRVEIEEA